VPPRERRWLCHGLRAGMTTDSGAFRLKRIASGHPPDSWSPLAKWKPVEKQGAGARERGHAPAPGGLAVRLIPHPNSGPRSPWVRHSRPRIPGRPCWPVIPREWRARRPTPPAFRALPAAPRSESRSAGRHSPGRRARRARWKPIPQAEAGVSTSRHPPANGSRNHGSRVRANVPLETDAGEALCADPRIRSSGEAERGAPRVRQPILAGFRRIPQRFEVDDPHALAFLRAQLFSEVPLAHPILADRCKRPLLEPAGR
jgi:hypothetical protein